MKKTFLLFISLVIILSNLSSIEKNNEKKDICVIPIHGEINRSMVIFIKRGIEKARSLKAKYVIFDIDTFGGRVDSALQITTLIGSIDFGTSIAYVTAGPESTGVSWSAGALISFSCNEIYMASGTSMGAAAPVYQTTEGMKAAEEKVVSAVRAQIAALAEKNGYPKDVALAMVDMDVELVEIYINDKLYAVNSDELINIEREAKDKGQKIIKGKIIAGKDKLLTLTANEMVKYGVSKGTLNNINDLYQILDISENKVELVEETEADKFITFLTSSAVIGILVVLALVALYIEVTTPGFGIPGTIAIVCFAIIFGTNALLGRVGSLELIVFLIGVVLLIIEIFIIPGFGVIGVSGIILIVLSLIFSMQDFVIPKFNWQWGIFFKNIFTISISFFTSVLFIMLLSRLLPNLKLFGRLALNSVQATSEGFTVQPDEYIKKYINKKGITTTVLRPSGKAEIDGEIVEVEADGEYLDKGVDIEVAEISGNRILVRKI